MILVAAKVYHEINEINFNMHWIDVDIDIEKIHGGYDG
jgi:hypothetical protein